MSSDPGFEPSARARAAVGVGHIALGLGLAFLALVALEARYLPVDLSIGLLAVLLTGSGAALLVRVRPAALLARIASTATLVLGLAGITGLIWTASYLRGIFGDIGRSSSAVFMLLVFTLLPYVVVYPIVALAVLRPPPSDSCCAPARKET